MIPEYPAFSGTNNWEILKKAVEGDKGVHKKLNGINAAAKRLRRAILNRDKKEIAAAITDEWENRKKLAKGVSMPKIEKLVRSAGKMGKIAAKICGPGGGGFLYIYVLEGHRHEIESALERAGGKIMNFNFVKKGLFVSVRKN